MSYFAGLFSNQTVTAANRSAIGKLLFPSLMRNYIVGSFSIGVALGVGVVHGMNKADTYYNSDRFTYSRYERIMLDMSRTEVEAILGRGTEIARSEAAIIFEWKNPDGSLITVSFDEDTTIQKAQEGL